MPTIISIILIVICLIIIAAIIIKKFPALAILDVDNIPGQKETQFKDKIMKARLERDLAHWGKVIHKITQWLDKNFSFLRALAERLKRLAEHYKRSQKLSLSERQEKVRRLLEESEADLKNEDLGSAETKLIEVIRLDNQNLAAFRELGEVYCLGKKYHEAKQTLEFALKLASKAKAKLEESEINFSLAEISQEAGDLTTALDRAQEALELIPNNPRYLDLLLELSIIKKDKGLAEETLAKIEAVNPENNKLAEWQEKIAAL